jgi:hypothetical protein
LFVCDEAREGVVSLSLLSPDDEDCELSNSSVEIPNTDIDSEPGRHEAATSARASRTESFELRDEKSGSTGLLSEPEVLDGVPNVRNADSTASRSTPRISCITM